MSDNQLTPVQEFRSQVMNPATADQFKKALPPHVSVEKFQSIVVSAVSKNADLMKADRASVFRACIECAQDGLLPNNKEAALVLFKNQAVYMPMIRGIYKLARNSGEIATLSADIVYKNDHFMITKGTSKQIVHEPNIDEPGDVRGVYAVCEFKDGAVDFEYMSKIDIEKTRSKSRSKNSMGWTDFYGEMCKKTVIHRIAKRLPLSSQLEKAIGRVESEYAFEQSREMQDVTTPDAPQRQDYLESGPVHMDDSLDMPTGEVPCDETIDHE